jgi:hypothetical protein
VEIVLSCVPIFLAVRTVHPAHRATVFHKGRREAAIVNSAVAANSAVFQAKVGTTAVVIA